MLHLIFLILCWIFVAVCFAGKLSSEGHGKEPAVGVAIGSAVLGTALWAILEAINLTVIPYLILVPRKKWAG